MDVRTKVGNALAALGASREDVAERLLAEGCFGSANAEDCPLQHYLEDVVGVNDPLVLSSKISFSEDDDGLRHSLYLRNSCQDFVRWFDGGGAPALHTDTDD